MAQGKTRRNQSDVAAALAAVKETDVKRVLDQLGNTQVSVQSTLAALGVTLSEKIEELRNLETAIEARREELKTIHEIEVEADTLEQIKQSVKEAERDAEERTRLRRKRWDDEEVERAQRWKREEEEHNYAVSQRQAQAEAMFAAQQAESLRAERIRAEDVERELKQRVDNLTAREEAFNAKEAEFAAFPAKLEQAVADARAAAEKSLSTSFSQERQLLVKDAEATKALAAAEKHALQEQIKQLSSQLESMQAQLDTARADARNIAQEAVKAASGRQALETLTDTVKAQSAPSGGGGRR